MSCIFILIVYFQQKKKMWTEIYQLLAECQAMCIIRLILGTFLYVLGIRLIFALIVIQVLTTLNRLSWWLLVPGFLIPIFMQHGGLSRSWEMLTSAGIWTLDLQIWSSAYQVMGSNLIRNKIPFYLHWEGSKVGLKFTQDWTLLVCI